MVDFTTIGLAIIVVGFLVVFLAVVVSARGSEGGAKRSQVKGGGVIMIGPIPIIFGSDAKWTTVAILLAIVLMVIVLLSGVVLVG